MKHFVKFIPLLLLVSMRLGAQDVCDTNLIKLDTLHFRSMADADSGVVLDVRTPEEWKTGYIRGAVNIDFRAPDFNVVVDKLDKTKTYLVYCEVGGRSALAAQYMLTHGFCRVFILERGIRQWKLAGYPVVAPAGAK